MTDAVLIRFIDGALAPLSSWRVERHLASCAACGDRATLLRERSARLHELYASLHPHPRQLPVQWLARARRVPPPRRSFALPAAAAAALVLAAVLVPPVYGFVKRWMTEPSTSAAPAVSAPRTHESTPAGAVAPDPPGTAVRFLPASSVVTVSFSSAEADAMLEVHDTPDAMVAFAPGIVPGRERPVLILPHELDVRNAGEAGGTYRLWLPPTARTVRVRVGGRTIATVSRADAPPGTLRIPLGR